MDTMKHVIVVCGTRMEWLNFNKWYRSECPATKIKVSLNSFTDSNLITYHCMIADDYSKMMGFDKYTTEVIRIGTWYEIITQESEKFLSLFRG